MSLPWLGLCGCRPEHRQGSAVGQVAPAQRYRVADVHVVRVRSTTGQDHGTLGQADPGHHVRAARSPGAAPADYRARVDRAGAGGVAATPTARWHRSRCTAHAAGAGPCRSTRSAAVRGGARRVASHHGSVISSGGGTSSSGFTAESDSPRYPQQHGRVGRQDAAGAVRQGDLGTCDLPVTSTRRAAGVPPRPAAARRTGRDGSRTARRRDVLSGRSPPGRIRPFWMNRGGLTRSAEPQRLQGQQHRDRERVVDLDDVHVGGAEPGQVERPRAAGAAPLVVRSSAPGHRGVGSRLAVAEHRDRLASARSRARSSEVRPPRRRRR